MPSSTAASAATWTSCCWTPWSRLASSTSFPAARSASRWQGLRRADVVVLSRADMLDRRTNGRRSVGGSSDYAPQHPWLEVRTRPAGVGLHRAGRNSRWNRSAIGRVAAFCGIGNPAGFRHTLAACGYTVADFREFPDHHAYTPRDTDRPGQVGR